MTILRIFEENPQVPEDRALVRSTRAHELQRVKAVPEKVPALRPFELADRHALLLGGTRRGKSVILELICRGLLSHGAAGLSLIDPHGTVASALIEWLAHPASGQHGRIVHIMGANNEYTIGLNPLRPYDGSWEAAHDAAMALAAAIEARFEASAEETPRLARIIYVAGMLCARHGLTLLELVELLSLGGEALRRSLLEDFDNRIVRRELEDLCLLASKSPREFLAIVESTKNRCVRWLGDRRLVRILGQKHGLDFRTVADNREIFIGNLSALNYADAALVGTIYTSMAFAAARRRPALQSARHYIVLDEAESLITPDVARMCDQSAKWGVNIVAAIQRLGQLRARGDFLFDALLTNCAVKICMGGLEAESALYMADNLFAGALNLAEDKPGSERPAAVAQTVVVLKNRTRSEQQSESETVSETSMRSFAHAAATSAATMHSSAVNFGSAENAAFVSVPPDQLIGSPPVISRTAGYTSSRAGSTASGTVKAASSSRQYAQAHGRSSAYAKSYGTTIGEGESEALATIYEWLPAQYTLAEQQYRHAALLMTLPRREAIVRIEHEAPFQARTVDRVPAFKSAEFKAELVPRYLANAARRSRYAIPNSDIDRELATRIDELTRPTPTTPEDFSPEPNPDAAHVAARARELQRAMQAAQDSTALPQPRPSLRLITNPDVDEAS